MPGARMKSPFASSSRSTRAFALPAMFGPRCVGRSLPHLDEREVAIPPAAILLWPRAHDDGAIIARGHRTGCEHAGLVLRREHPRHGHLRAVYPDGERLVADRAGSRARTDPAAG